MAIKPGKLKLAILISGRGSNMKALIEACNKPGFPAETALVVSNRPDAGGLDYAQKAGVPTAVIDHKQYDRKAAFEQALQNKLALQNIDLICLAGFMRILSADFIEKWPDKIINIHPSLLPDYKGLNTYRRALEDKQTESGCSVHFVIPEMDSGPVIIQKKVTIHKNDTPETLAARILEQEHLAYPEAVRLIGENRVRIIDGKAEIR